MEQLVNLKNRIKAVGTIKKITHAMRLISMSNHSKLRTKKEFLATYSQEVKRIGTIINSLVQQDQIQENKIKKTLIIIIASEKGLCGNFNSKLFIFIKKAYPFNEKHDLITVGKQAAIYTRTDLKKETIKNFDIFNSLNFIKISQDLTNFILENHYTDVIIFSNYQKTFFVQQSKKTNLLSIKKDSDTKINQLDIQDYLWAQKPEEINEKLKKVMISVNLQELLFESLLAEQASRFISMDNATRNAEQLINQMKLNYNKIRQTSITRELTELSSSI
ncbi:F0F1 ATP synthase subunit gamma [Candidatus Dependentiae bacterium]|nr:F0F1 ATP synthase subunit gamma [Candidatus Dependentiae bacterium]